MTHANAPLSIEGRRRLVERCRTRPIAHVAAEMGISRACASKWVNRYRRHGEQGLQDRSSVPHTSPNATPADVIAKIVTWRRERKWPAARITHELAAEGFRINRRTVTRHLTRLGLGQRRFIDPDGDTNRQPGKIIARWPGHMAHLDVKKVGRIPDGGGWRVHGRDSDQAKSADRAKTAGAKAGYVYLHSIIDGFSRLAYTEPLADEKGATAAAFLARAKVWFAAHGITHIHRVVTDNGACYRSGDFARIVGATSRHKRTKPYTPRHNGKIERYQRTWPRKSSTPDPSPAKTNDQPRSACGTSTTTTIDPTAPPEAAHQHPASVADDEIGEVLELLWGTAAVNTWNARRAAVLSWLGWCAEYGYDGPAAPAWAKRLALPDSQTPARSKMAIDRPIARREVHLREKTLWRMLYETAARAEEILGVNIEDLDLAGRRCPVKAKGARAKARRRGQVREDFVLETVYWDASTARLLPRLLRGRTHGPVFVTHRRPGPGKVVSPRDVCPDIGLARLSYGQARALLDEHTALHGPGTGWDLHKYHHSALTHLGEQGASLLMLMAKSRHKEPENVRRYFKPSPEAIAELTSLLAPGDSRR